MLVESESKLEGRSMLKKLWVENYRSLHHVSLELGQLTVVTGPNGSGKSNLYNALGLLQSAAAGQLSTALLSEGGMPSALWAGKRNKGPVRMTMGFELGEVSYEFTAGLVPTVPSDPPNPFVLDPEIKNERIWYGPRPTKSTTVIDRSSGTASLTNTDGSTELLKAALDPAESIISQVADPSGYPELSLLRQQLASWRFYHRFDTSRESPARRVVPGVRTGAVAADGSNLGPAVATLADRGDLGALVDAIDSAFPGYLPVIVKPESGLFGVSLKTPAFRRPLSGLELSDGQLQFLCLATALLSTRPPPLLVLNEPETSLHPTAVQALAVLIRQAAKHSQVWVTTHDAALRDALTDTAITHDLSIQQGATVVTNNDNPPD